MNDQFAEPSSIETIFVTPDNLTGYSTRMNKEGVKFDNDKARIELVPPEMIFATAEILTFGAKKYADRNWERGMSWGRVFGALMRHLWAWWGGQGPTTRNFALGDLDDETGFSHLWHAACCVSFLVAYEERGVGKDDRLGGSASE